jgi:predicted ArsR family transcriptional regulator
MSNTETDLDRVAALAEPVRRRLYEVVARAGEPVDRDDAAATAGVTRALAAFHLDRLVAAGLLGVT